MGVFDTRSIRPLATLLVRKMESLFRLYDDPHSFNWNNYIKDREKLRFMKISEFF